MERVTTELELYSLNHKAVMSHTDPVSTSVKRLEADIEAVIKTLPNDSRDRVLLATASGKLDKYIFDLGFFEGRYGKMYEMGMLWTRENQEEVDHLADQSRRDIAEVAALLRKK